MEALENILEDEHYFYYKTFIDLFATDYAARRYRDQAELMVTMRSLENIWQKSPIDDETLEIFFEAAEDQFNYILDQKNRRDRWKR